MPSSPFGPAVGEVLVTFSCEYKSNRGILYVATQALCFHSNFLGFETSRLVVPWKSVLECKTAEECATADTFLVVAKHNGNGRDTALKRTYEFRVILGETKVVLKNLRDACRKYGGGGSSSSSGASANQKESNGLGTVHEVESDFEGDGASCSSAPARSLWFEQVSGVTSESYLEEDAASCPNSSIRGKPIVRRTMSEPLTERGKSKGKQSSQFGTDTNILAELTFSALPDSRQVPHVVTPWENETDDKEDVGKAPEPPPESGPKGKAASVEMLRAWNDLLASKEPPFKEVACQGTALPCSVDEFYDKFLSDDAPHSMASFQKAEKGDTDFETSNWTPSDDGLAYTRTMSYIHPVSAPMAPPTAQARKRQTLRRFAQHGICMETKTKIDDVPMSDCFFVEDRILVEPRPDGGVNLTALFEVRFVKSTMFRKIIENTTRGEYQKFWKGFANMAMNALASTKESRGGLESREELAPAPAPTSTPAQTPAPIPVAVPEVLSEVPKIGPRMGWLMIPFMLFVTTTQLVLLYMVCSMRKSIGQLEEAVAMLSRQQ